MSILTGKPTSVVPGTPSGSITLSPATLISQMSITDPYWSVSSNWMRVAFIEQDATGSERRGMSFENSGSNVTTFKVSVTARQNGWKCIRIEIYDFDNAVYVIQRTDFTTPAEFDILVSAFGVGNLRPEYTQAFSMSAWIKLANLNYNTIFNNQDSSLSRGLFFFVFNGQLNIQINHSTGNQIVKSTDLSTLNDNAWHHVVVTYDGSGTAAGTLLYIDNTLPTTLTSQATVSATILAGGPLRMGIWADGSFGPYNGRLDEFAFYQGLALSGPQVTAIYNGGSPQNLASLDSAPSLVTWIRAEAGLTPADTDTGVIYDRASGAHNGTTHNTSAGFLSSTVTTGGFTLRSMLFDGVDDYISLA